MKPRICLIPKCRNTRRTRGLCHPHYQNAQRMRRDGVAEEGDLVRRGLMLPPGPEGSSPIAKGSSECLLLGSKVIGDTRAALLQCLVEDG